MTMNVPPATDAHHTADRLRKIHALLDELTSSPWSHDVLELAMAAAISVPIADQDDTAPVWLIVVGVPSGDKTATVLCLKGPKALYVDTLTDNALSSGFAPEKGQQRKPDLLTRIEQTGIVCLVIKDLTTLFSLRDDRVKKLLGDLQAIYDGEYAKATGTVDVLTYKTRFSIVACITPLVLVKHHRYMSAIGPRFVFYRVPVLTDEEREEGFALTWANNGRKAKLNQLRKVVHAHVKELLTSPSPLAEVTHEQQQAINRLAELLAHGRAAIRWGKTQLGGWEIEGVQIEEPFRAMQQLRNLALALARVHGRTHITDHELELVRRVVLSSMPVDRADVLAMFPAHPEKLTVKLCAEGIRKSDDRADQLLTELVRVGLLIVEPGTLSVPGNRPKVYRPVAKFADLICKRVEPVNHHLDPELSDKTPPKNKDGEGTLGELLSEKSEERLG